MGPAPAAAATTRKPAPESVRATCQLRATWETSPRSELCPRCPLAVLRCDLALLPTASSRPGAREARFGGTCEVVVGPGAHPPTAHGRASQQSARARRTSNSTPSQTHARTRIAHRCVQQFGASLSLAIRRDAIRNFLLASEVKRTSAGCRLGSRLWRASCGKRLPLARFILNFVDIVLVLEFLDVRFARVNILPRGRILDAPRPRSARNRLQREFTYFLRRQICCFDLTRKAPTGDRAQDLQSTRLTLCH